MQTALLSVSLCDKIDRKIRNFIWGSSEGVRKIHNVNWDTVCKPKDQGGLGLRSARDLNKAFLMKLAWSLVSRPNEFWAKVLITKYMTLTDNGYMLTRKKGFSNVRRGVMKVWQETQNGIHWSIRDGRNTKFWTDRLLDSGVVLIDHAICLQGIDPSHSVVDFCLNGSWNLRELCRHLPENLVLQVFGMSPPREGAGAGSMVWGLESNGRFSVKTAYYMLREIEKADNDSYWRSIWRWEELNKVRHFLWLVSHNKLMTNVECARRRLNDDSSCSVCGSQTEDLNHVFRSCPRAVQVWNRVLPEAVSTDQGNQNFNSWWTSGITNAELLVREWEITINHIYREANMATDFLANAGHELELGTTIFSVPCIKLLDWFRYDLVGICLPRRFNNTS
ncbi:Putative ribonuclease H protein At1g65750 [Linum perenne]